jgi:tetratricopeptide (TPR) repeat protein
MRVLLEDFTPSGAGLRWQAHQDYYREEGLEVFFRQEVPYNITSNPCYAEQVARLCIAQHAQKPDLHLLELGGGNGIFAYNFLKAFERLSPTLFQKVRYVLSDFSEPMLNTLSAHTAFSPWLAKGQLELKVLDASGKTSISENWDGIIANYLFSTFPTEVVCKPGDEWCIEKTRLIPSLRPEWLDFIEQYLHTRDLSAPLPQTHTHHERFAALFIAQHAVAKTLRFQVEAGLTETDELWEWLETQLSQQWGLHQQAQDHDLLHRLLITPLKTTLTPHLWQAVLAAENENAADTAIDRRFFPVKLDAFPPAHQEALSTVSAFYPIAYAPDVLEALHFWKTHLKPDGFLLISDKASVSQKQTATGTVSIARHGGTLSHALHWPLCLQILPDALYTKRTHHAIQTLCYSAHPTPELSDRFQHEWVEHPRHLLSHALLEGGQALLQSNRMEAAYRSLKEALDYRPSDGTLQYFCALCCINDGDYVTALTILESPHDDIFALFNRDILIAEAYQATGQYAKAIPAYERSMAYGENALAYYQMALCQQALKAYDAALKSVKKAYALHPQDEDIQALQALLASSLK